MAQQTVVGIFDSASEAQEAVDQLVNAGFSRSSIDLSSSSTSTNSTTDNDAIIPDRHANTSGTMTEEVADDAKDTGDSIGGFFRSLFGDSDDDDNSRKHAEVGRRGSVVTVHAQSEDEAERAADILDDNGAVDVDERASQYGYGSADYGSAASAATGTSAYTGVDTTTSGLAANTGTDETIKVIQENLEVGKREVQTGGVRVRSRIVERPVEESLRLREERVTVQRTPVNRPATDADLNAFKEGQIEMTEHAEVPVVSKTANVVEEISVGKQVNERVETVRDTVRNTEVDVENVGTTGTTTTDPMTTNRTDYDDDLNTTSTNR